MLYIYIYNITHSQAAHLRSHAQASTSPPCHLGQEKSGKKTTKPTNSGKTQTTQRKQTQNWGTDLNEKKAPAENGCGGKKPRAKMQQDRGDMKKQPVNNMLKTNAKNHAKNQWKKSGIVTPFTKTSRNTPGAAEKKNARRRMLWV